jgi:hypothetical protein
MANPPDGHGPYHCHLQNYPPGFLMSLLFAACASSFLYLVEMIVRTNRVTWEDFTRSFGVYLWDVVGVSFALWLFWFVATPFLHQLPQGHVAVLAIQLVLVVLFNAVPELIYLGHSGLVDLLARSYQFIAANWIEWFPPNLLLIAGMNLLWVMPLGEGAPLLLLRVTEIVAEELRALGVERIRRRLCEPVLICGTALRCQPVATSQ